MFEYLRNLIGDIEIYLPNDEVDVFLIGIEVFQIIFERVAQKH